jgi:predicted ATPase/DNA-binding SARP family transcriptional activator
MQTARLEIKLLGDVRVAFGDSVVDRLPTQRVAALLAYLIVQGGWQPREQIAEAIWPDQPDGNGQASLRNALSVLRKILEPPGFEDGAVLQTTRTQARIIADHCDCDVWQFRKAVAEGKLAEAISIYSGDLSSGIYDEWLEPLREDLRQAFIGAVSREASRALDTHDLDLAILYGSKWRDQEPFEAEAAKTYAFALAAAGRSQAAIAAVERFRVDHLAELGEDAKLDWHAVRREIDQRSSKGVPTSNPESRPGIGGRRLPTYLSRFFGREEECCQVREWAESSSRLLTVIGMGGIGKTRLVIEVGQSLSAQKQEVVFVPLQAATSREAIVSAVMDALEIRESDTESSEQAVHSALNRRQRPTILILDNLEQVVEPAAQLIMGWVGLGENLKFLCTSRELLGIEGEQLLHIAPLEVPRVSERDDELRNVGSFAEPAIQMFVDRARNSRADFSLTARNYREVADLCQELDGLPLAIEIMAGWSGTWSVAEMRRNVRNHRVIARKKGHDLRHNSLESCIDWSFNLLDDGSKQFLCVLSLFRGGWTLDAVQAIMGGEDAESRLAGLVDRSLVSTAEDDVGLRFFMLESVAAYCRARLDRKTAESAGARFVSYFLQLAIDRANPCAGAEERANHRRLDRERENIEAAVGLCEAGLAPLDDTLAMLGRLHLHWSYRGQARAGIALLERLLSLESNEPVGFGRVLGVQTLSVLAQECGDIARAEWAMARLQELSEIQDEVEMRFRIITQIGNFHNRYGRFVESLEQHSVALEVARQMKLPRMEAVAHCNMAEALFGLDRLPEAIENWNEAAVRDRQNGNTGGEAMLLLGLAEALRGDSHRAAAHLGTYLRNSYNLDYARGYTRAVYYTAYVAALSGNVPLARELVASSRAFGIGQALNYDVVEAKCFLIVDRAIEAADPEGSVPDPKPVPIDRAVEVALSFLDQAISLAG